MRGFLLTLITILFCLVGSAEAYPSTLAYIETEYIPADQATVAEYEEILNIVECFNIYTSFFTDTYNLEGKLVSRHGEEMENGFTYLQEAFSEELSFRILDYFTYWDDKLEKQIIICQEGIPVFTEDDLKNCSFYAEDDRLTLKVVYDNCYVSGDSYIYYITAHHGEGKLLINDLQWVSRN